VVRAPDGTIWKIATESKKGTGPATRQIDGIVLLLGVADMRESKRFYADRGLTVAKSYSSKYIEFDAPSGAVTLGLYRRRALAKDARVSPDGSGPHRLSNANRQAAGVETGDEVEVELEFDPEPRVVAEPADFAGALGADPIARAAYDRLPDGRKREHVRAIESAKRPETRTRRIEKALAALRDSEPAGRAAARGRTRASKSMPGES
jgi:hypothetical protein